MALAKTKHVDQWDKIEVPNMSTENFSNLVFDKGSKNICWKKGKYLQQMVLEKLEFHMAEE